MKELTLIIQFKPKEQLVMKMVVMHQKIPIRDNGKTILNMVLANNPTQVSEHITDIGKMVKGTEKES